MQQDLRAAQSSLKRRQRQAMQGQGKNKGKTREGEGEEKAQRRRLKRTHTLKGRKELTKSNVQQRRLFSISLFRRLTQAPQSASFPCLPRELGARPVACCASSGGGETRERSETKLRCRRIVLVSGVGKSNGECNGTWKGRRHHKRPQAVSQLCRAIIFSSFSWRRAAPGGAR